MFREKKTVNNIKHLEWD